MSNSPDVVLGQNVEIYRYSTTPELFVHHATPFRPHKGPLHGLSYSSGVASKTGPIMLVPAVVAVALLVSGAYYFRRMEKTFADVV